MFMADLHFDVVLVGGGVMSATLGMLLRQLDPALKIAMVEKLPDVALESSDGWNNAGTGHAGYCELNYTPQAADGSVTIERALNINAAFETSLQFWSWLVETKQLPAPRAFINPTPHLSVVWGRADVNFLRQRFEKLQQHHLFSDMEYSEAPAQLAAWMPLVMEGRDASQPVAATRVAYGTDVDFGSLTRHLVATLQQHTNFTLFTGHEVKSLTQETNGKWQIRLHDPDHTSTQFSARFVFLGAGGAALGLLQKSGIAEGKGYGGFPVSGQWLVCNKPEIVARHHAKVYGKAPLGAPPMSVPHLDTRIIGGQPALLFGPYAGFTTRFLKQGSLLDLLKSVKADNLRPMLAAGMQNTDLTRYLISEVFQSHEQRVEALSQFYPQADKGDWSLVIAGQRVQIIKACGEKGGRLEFGTEIVTTGDGSLAALLGASPGASTSVQAMISVIERCFASRVQSGEWQARLREMVPSYGQSLIEDADLLKSVRNRTLQTLRLTN
jgi:malate dehydrogenase (quinone)